VITALTSRRLGAVMRPKADAAWHLHELTAGTPLQAFILYSAAAAALGSAGQGSYTAANAFLDALASHRHATGLPAVSLAWGLWAGTSAMSSHLDQDDLARITRSGMTPLTPRQGLALLDTALTRDEPHLIPAHLNLTRPAAQGAGGEVPALLRQLVGPGRRPAAGQVTEVGQDGLRRQVAGLPAAERDRVLVDLVRAHASAVLGHAAPEAIEPGRAFRELGFDSLTAVELRNRLQAATGLPLPSTAVFDYPSAKVLADFLRTRLLGGQVRQTRWRGSRSRSWRWGVASPAEWSILTGCGSWWRRGPMPSRSCLATGAGIPKACITRILTTREPLMPGTAGSWPMWPRLTRGSSGSARARRWRWTRSSG
jgi:acyl carrier protein